MNGYQFRLCPTKEQEQILLRWIGCRRLIYNAKVSEDRYFRAFKRRFLAVVGEAIPIGQGYSHFKTEQTPFLHEIPSQILRNGAVLWKQTPGDRSCSTPSTKRCAPGNWWSKYRLCIVHRSAPLAATLIRTIGRHRPNLSAAAVDIQTTRITTQPWFSPVGESRKSCRENR